MQNTETEFSAYQDKINQSENILVVYGQNATFSAVSLATSLYLWMKEKQKNVFLAAPTDPVVEFSNLVGINKVKKILPKQNLTIKIAYDENKVAKVLSDLNQEKSELSIVVRPQKGNEPVALKDVKLTYQAGDYDLIFLIDVQEKTELEKLFADNETILEKSEKIIAINSLFGACPVMANLIKELGKTANFASWWGKMLQENQIVIDADQASNLFMGLEKETLNFTNPECEASDFELAAWLLRQGAIRHQVDKLAIENFQPENHLPRIGKEVKIKEQNN